jgi:hypothetical protein
MASVLTDGPTITDPDVFLDRVVDCADVSFERLEPMTDYRRDPGEARILYKCRLVGKDRDVMNGTGRDETYVMKVKVQY